MEWKLIDGLKGTVHFKVLYLHDTLYQMFSFGHSWAQSADHFGQIRLISDDKSADQHLHPEHPHFVLQHPLLPEDPQQLAQLEQQLGSEKMKN